MCRSNISSCSCFERLAKRCCMAWVCMDILVLAIHCCGEGSTAVNYWSAHDHSPRFLVWPSLCCACRVFEPRYRRLLKCCQDNNGCFSLVSYGVGISVTLDRVQLEEDSSISVSIRGGRRFVVQQGSSTVMPASFGLTMVHPKYIHVSLLALQLGKCVCSHVSSNLEGVPA